MGIHRPPADIDDFSKATNGNPQDLYTAWNDMIDFMMQEYDQGLFFNSSTDISPGSPVEPPGITWNAFPLALEKLFSALPPAQASAAALRFAETLRPLDGNRADTGKLTGFVYRRQDEYCEWFADTVNGRITRISFTCENPEYWGFLFSKDPTLVVSLYNSILGRTDIVEDDLKWPWDVVDPKNSDKILFKQDSYNSYNKWNTLMGSVHLTHPANSLGAEIDLAAKATRKWPVALGKDDDAQRLTCCSGWGNPNRSSDPNIGKGVFDIAATGLAVTLAEPVGLYILQPNLVGRLRAPDGTDIGEAAVHVKRGSPDGTKVLRLEIIPPPEATYGLNDCTLDGEKLEYGGQIARLITMAVFGAGKQISSRSQIILENCENFCCAHPDAPDFLLPVEYSSEISSCQNVSKDDFPMIPQLSTIQPGKEMILHSTLDVLITDSRTKVQRPKAKRLAE